MKFIRFQGPILALVCVLAIFTACAVATPVRHDTTVSSATSKSTQLCNAAAEADLLQVRRLLDEGADADAACEAGGTVLHNAVTSEDVDVIRLLLVRGATVNRFVFATNKRHTRNPHTRKQIADLLNTPRTTLEGDQAAADERFEREQEAAIAARVASEQAEQAAERARLDAVFERDQTLPVEVRKDKYMVALTAHLKSQRYQEALDYFGFLDRMEVELPASFTFYYAEAYLRSGRSELALAKLHDYFKLTGSDGKHYKRALELLNEAEAQ